MSILRSGDVYSIVTRGKLAIPHFYPAPFVGGNARGLGPARALQILVHFLSVLGITTTEMTKFKVLWRT